MERRRTESDTANVGEENNNNNNIHICIAPYGRNFRGAGAAALENGALHWSCMLDIKTELACE